MMTTQPGRYTLLYPVLAAILFLVAAGQLAAQDRDKARAMEYVQQQEQARKAATMREYDSAVLFLENGMHARADVKFRYVLANLKSLPSDLTFHFGKNSFFLKQYQQSIDWLNKYIQLKGTNGQFSREAVELKEKAEKQFLAEKAVRAQEVEQVLSTNYEIDCGPSGMVTCPVCRGEHVIIRRGTFSNEYRTCPYCNEHGLLTCVEYNQLLRGELEPKQ